MKRRRILEAVTASAAALAVLTWITGASAQTGATSGAQPAADRAAQPQRRGARRPTVTPVATPVATTAVAAATPAPAPAEDAAATLARGRYLVHEVARCTECHTPRDHRGVLEQGQMLMGAPIPFQTPYERWDWAGRSVRIAGLGSYTEAHVMSVLTRGVDPNGRVPKKPMPAYHLSQADAQAITAYLRSIGATRSTVLGR